MHTFLLTLEPSSYKEEEFEPNRFMGSASVEPSSYKEEEFEPNRFMGSASVIPQGH